jgi:thiamine biosynthesis lipoprotein
MGTTFGMVLYAPDEDTANRAFAAAFARIADLNRICSDYDPDSELSRLSTQSPTTTPVPVSEDLFRVLRAARELSERSRGAFDPTIGPVTKLWRRARLQHKPPDAARLREAMSAVGFAHLVLHGPEPCGRCAIGA